MGSCFFIFSLRKISQSFFCFLAVLFFSLFNFVFIFVSVLLCKFFFCQISSNFEKIRRTNGSFLADDIFLDRLETIKVAGEEGIRNGLKFLILNSDTCISNQWKRGESQTGHFHVASLQNRLKFSLFGFV